MHFGMAIYCRQGTIQIAIDGRQYRLEQGQRLSYQEGSLIEECLASSDADLVLMGLSWELIGATEALNTVVWNIADYVRRSPIYTLSKDAIELSKIYHQQIHTLCHSANPLFRDELLHIHIQALLYSFIREVSEEIRQATPQDLTRASQQARLFFDLLGMQRGRIRSVSEVATLMNLTPKYLSRIIKEQTGETPIHFIHQYMMRAITQELRYSSKTAKEIAFQQGFSSLAFFGSSRRVSRPPSTARSSRQAKARHRAKPRHTCPPQRNIPLPRHSPSPSPITGIFLIQREEKPPPPRRKSPFLYGIFSVHVRSPKDSARNLYDPRT